MKNYIKGTILLSCGLMLTKLIGAIYRIVLSNILNSEGIGIYQMVFPVYTLFLVFITGGISVYVCQRVASNLRKETNNSIVIRNAIVVAVSFGILFGLILLTFAKIIAGLQGNETAYIGYIAISVSIVFSGVTSVFKGYFQGKGNMLPTTISQIFEQICKVCFGVALSLVLIKYGIIYGVLGAFLGVTISEIICFILMLIMFNRRKVKIKSSSITTVGIFDFIKNFLPLSIGSIMIPLMQTVDSFMVINLLYRIGYSNLNATSLYGIYAGMILPIINFPIIFCSALCTASLPIFVAKIKKNEDCSLEFGNIVKFVWAISIACGVGIFFLAEPIIKTIFPVVGQADLDVAIMLMKISCFSILPITIMQLCTMLLNANNEFRKPVIALAISFSFRVVLTYVLISIPTLNVLGMAISNVVCFGISGIIDLIYVKKFCYFKLSLGDVLIPIIGTSFMALLIVGLSFFLQSFMLLNLIICVSLGALFYLTFLVCFRILDLKFITNKLFRKT